VDYAHEGALTRGRPYYVVTLEYGPAELFREPFNIPRVRHDDSRQAHRSAGIHPVVRRFEAGEERAAHHVLEDLFAAWVEHEVHLDPLQAFLERDLADSGVVPAGNL
jgi:hypothetical protein